jgi:hypothetical protein
MESSFADFIQTDLALLFAFKTHHTGVSFLCVFGASALHARTPHAKTRWLTMFPHEINDFSRL